MRLQTKLFAIFLLSGGFLTATMFLVIQWSIGQGMVEYVNSRELEGLQPLVDELEDYYGQYGSWRDLEDRPRLFFDRFARHFHETEMGLPPPPKRAVNAMRRPPNSGGPPRMLRGQPRRIAPIGFAMLDSNENVIIGRLLDKAKYNSLELVSADAVVGYLRIPIKDQLNEGYELSFVEQQNTTLFLYSLIILCVTMLIALPLARHIIRPIKQLTQGMHELTQGDFDKRLALKRRDEFEQLATDFNRLASTLKENESARKRWLADVSHELRTPVAVLKGEIEAVLDGIRPLSVEQFESAQEEIHQLERLIEDLHELVRSDNGTLHYQKQTIDLKALLLLETTKYTDPLKEKGISLVFDLPDNDVKLHADEVRFKQLIGNLVSNVIRYAEGAKTLKISLEASNEKITLVYEDDGTGVEDEQLDKLFEYLYRTELSRNRTTGGSGLGLAICQKIVTAHHGRMWASKSVLNGLAINIQFNMTEQ